MTFERNVFPLLDTFANTKPPSSKKKPKIIRLGTRASLPRTREVDFPRSDHSMVIDFETPLTKHQSAVIENVLRDRGCNFYWGPKVGSCRIKIGIRLNVTPRTADSSAMIFQAVQVDLGLEMIAKAAPKKTSQK